MVHIGDILYALYGATSGEVSRAKLDGAINQAILAIIPNDEVNADFLVEWFRKEKAQITDKYLQGGQGNLSAQIIKDLKVTIPMREEQNKIGEYFSKVNHLITLHQRILVKFVEKLASVWEQRKFGEIVEKYEDPVETPTEGYTRLGIRSHAKGTFHSYVEKGKELETAKMFRVAADKFIVNITFGWEHAVAITDENDAGKLVSHRFPQYSFNAGMEPKFFRYLILDENFKHHLELSSPGGAGRNRVLKLSDMLQYKMNFPSEAEQKKIAAYFDDLDHLITLHHRKYKNLHKISLNDWEQRKLGDIADVIKLAGFEFTEHVVYSDEGNIIALRGLNIKNGQLILDDVKYIDGSNFSKLSRSKLFIDDIMFTYVGTVGEVAIIKENDRFYLAPNVSRIRVKSDDSPKFISHYMRTDN